MNDRKVRSNGGTDMTRRADAPVPSDDDVALFRYRVICTLLELSGRPLAAAVRELSAKPWVIPGSRRTRIAEGTIRHWLRAYRERGVDGLKRCRRSRNCCLP